MAGNAAIKWLQKYVNKSAELDLKHNEHYKMYDELDRIGKSIMQDLIAREPILVRYKKTKIGWKKVMETFRI